MLVEMIESKSNILKLKQKLQAQNEKFSFFNPDDQKMKFLAVYSKNTIVGLLGFKDRSSYDPDYMELSYCEVLVSSRNKGIASNLVKEIMTIASVRQQPLWITAYEADGLVALKPLVKKEAELKKVHIIEQGNAYDIANDPTLW